MNALDERMWYMLLCNKDETDRIMEPQHGRDILLKERAAIIIDNARLTRVYKHKQLYAEVSKKNWSFEQTFKSAHYDFVLSNLGKDEAEECKKIVYGDMYCKKVNAYAYNEPGWGKFVCLNVGTRFFINFMNLALSDWKKHDIPAHVIMNSLRIAIRTFLGCEAMDFEMDPRGIIPYELGKDIRRPISGELAYIIGHEFCHHLLNHFDDTKTSKQILWNTTQGPYEKKIYNTSQKQEFEADLCSLTLPKYKEKLYSKVYEGALIWFLSLQLAETASETIYPSSPLDIKTHPSALDRYKNIRENAPCPRNFNSKRIQKVEERVQILAQLLRQDITDNYGELYDEDIYGSVYLDKPNTKWRGRELIDRVDY